MRVLIILGVFFAVSGIAGSTLVHPINVKAVVFQDQGDSSRFLAISESKKWMRIFSGNQSREVLLKSVDTDCLGRKGRYVHPFIVSPARTCRVIESLGEIKTLNKSVAPKGTFILEYLGVKKGELKFLVNAREFPGGQEGKILIKKVNLRTGKSQIVAFMTGVPGFSGGMGLDAGDEFFYVTVSTGLSANQIYGIDSKALLSKSVSGKTFRFKDVFADQSGVLQDLKLSFRLWASEGVLIYDNRSEWGDYPGYRVEMDFAVSEIKFKSDCMSLGVSKGRFWQHCMGTGIEAIDFEDL